MRNIQTDGNPREHFLNSEAKSFYAIIRHNIRTYVSEGIVQVIMGKPNAENIVEQFERGQSSEDRHAGWRYFLEKTEIKPGTAAPEASRLRQQELETRELKAMQDADLLRTTRD